MSVDNKNITTTSQKDTSNETSVSILIGNLCKASRQSGSGAQVAKLLEHRKKHSLDWRAPLLAQGSNNERLIYERLFSEQLLSDNTSTWEQLVHALLISPSSYETPWRTACDVVAFCLEQCDKSNGNNQVSEDSFRSCITNIQSFLQQAVVGWCEEERKRALGHQHQPPAGAAQSTAGRKNPSDWLVQLVIHLIRPLLQNSKSDRETDLAGQQLSNNCSSDKTNNNKKGELWTMIPLPLIPMIVSVAKDLDASFFHSILDHIYHKEHKIRADRLLAWLNLSSDLRLYLRSQDWQWIQERMEQNLLSACYPQAQLPDYTPGLLALCLTLLHGSLESIDKQKQQEHRRRLRAWQELLLELLWLTATDEILFSKVESTCFSRLVSLSSTALEQWASVLSTPSSSSSSTDSNKTNTRRSWVDACFWLIVYRAAEQQKSGGGAQLVSHLMERALVPAQAPRSKKQAVLRLDVVDCSWKQLVRLAGIRLDQSSSSTSCKSDEECLQWLKQTVSNRRYQGRGKFSGGDQSVRSDIWTLAGQLVYFSLSLGSEDGPTRDNDSFSVETLERAQVWVTSANKVLSSPGHHFLEKAMAMIVLVTLYIEMPVERSSIEQSIVQAFSRNFGTATQSFTAARFYCIVISCVIQSAQHDSLQSAIEMGRITQILMEPLPMDLFMEMVQVLLPLAGARRLLFSISQKTMTNGELTLFFLDESNNDGATQQILERQRCLYALVALNCSSTCNKTEEDAWLLLSSIIVDHQVQLPFSLRCWLLATLRQQVKKGCICKSISLRLLRCCVSKLLDFFGLDEDGFQTFCPERAFVFRKNGLPPKVVEDLVGLVGLVLELVHLALLDGNDLLGRDVKELTMAWHEYFLLRLNDDPKLNSFATWTAATKVHRFEDDPVLPFAVAMYCLSLMLQSLLCRPSANKAGNTASVETLRKMLEKQEIACVPEAHDSLLCWQSSSPQVLWARKEVTLLSDVLSDLLIEFFVAPRWPWSAKHISRRDDDVFFARMASILLAKRKLQEGSSNSNYVPVRHHEDMLRTYTALLQDQCQFLKSALAKETADENLIDLLNMVADTCDLGRVCCEKNDNILPESWLVAVHKVYDCLGNESSSVCVLSALENACAFDENGERISVSNTKDLLSEFRTLDDVDRYVRAIRLSLIRAISSATSVVLRAIDAHEAGNDGLGDLDDLASQSTDQRLLEILLSFCNDLHLGVEGESGGLSSDLFQCYLDCIDKTAQLIAQNIFGEPHQTTRVSSETLSRLGRAAESLEKIVNVVSGDKASPFKGLIGVLAYTLPSLARSLVCTGVPINSFDEQLHVLIGRRSFRMRLFSDCTSTLAGLSKTYGYLWWREKAIESLSDDEDGECHRGCHEEGNERAEKLENIGGHDEKLCSFDLPDERVWSRAFVMAAQAFEDDFNDVISCHRLLDCQSLPSITVSQSFVRLRVKEFSEYISALSRPLDKVAPEIVNPQDVIDLTSPTNGGSVSMEMFRVCAMALPPAVKTRYSVAVDRFFTMLNQSVKKLCDIIKSSGVSEELEGNSKSLVEALSVFTGWLTAEIPDGAIDIGLGIRRWQHTERVHFEDFVSKSKSFTSEDNVLKKLPRMELKVDEFEFQLQQLSDLLRDNSETNRSSDVISKMNLLLSSERKAKSFRQLLSVKMKDLNKQQQLLEKDIGVIRKEPNRGRGKRKITEELERRAKKERNRQTIRSRNAVVDEWLEIDRGNEDRGGNNDAFADLEDFLVPG